jgi:ubiquinone/menaquinone biosynthesis C-methylase UbiE
MADRVSNPFTHASAAKRYAAGRPYFHPVVAQRILDVTGAKRFSRVLDVGCGTGQSTQALSEIADVVDAIDISQEMLAETEPNDRIRYQVAPAERLPFANSSFELVTVGLAYHWFDQGRFLDEARRVLQPSSWLIIYNFGFTNKMAENAGFGTWADEVYLRRFPIPPRCSTDATSERARSFGFERQKVETFTHDEHMTAEQFTGFLVTQSNVISIVERGAMTIEDAIMWIEKEVASFFRDEQRAMMFSGTIAYFRRNESN